MRKRVLLVDLLDESQTPFALYGKKPMRAVDVEPKCYRPMEIKIMSQKY
jgi:hypothetical protein